MRPIAVLRKDPAVPPGYLADALDRAGVPWRLVRLDDGDALPRLESVAGVVALGGLMGAYDVDRYPYLGEEKRFLARCVDGDVPVLAICLGAQLLADVLGGKAYLAEVPEAGYGPVELTEQGGSDPVVSTLADRPVLRLHQDTWDPPPGATSLATGGGFEQAYRVGSALGIQPHPEATPEIVAGWLMLDGCSMLVRSAGGDPDELVAAVADARAEAEATAARFFEAWLEESRVASREP